MIFEKEITMRKLAIISALTVFAATAAAQDTKIFNVNDSHGRDVVTFTSHAPLETVVGTTSKITGHIVVDPNNILGAADGRFEVDLASLKTGIAMRDGHMRDKFLETAKYPNAVFVLTKVIKSDKDTLLDQTPVNLIAEGDFTLHGITRKITVPLIVTYFKESKDTENKAPGDLLHIEGAFDVLLSDYRIDRPQFVILKLDDKQVVDIDAFGSTSYPPPGAVE